MGRDFVVARAYFFSQGGLVAAFSFLEQKIIAGVCDVFFPLELVLFCPFLEIFFLS